MKNKWKIAFLLLLGINLVAVIVIVSLAIVPSNDQKSSPLKKPVNGYVSFHVKSNKNDINLLINHYLKEQAADSPIDYRVSLGNEVMLNGRLSIVGEIFNLQLTFEPDALNNGDLVLKQKSMSIGSLKLPISFVLNVIRETYRLPDGVEIRPNDKLVYIHMQQLKLNSDMKISVDQFDLRHDKIAFTILVPVK